MRPISPASPADRCGKGVAETENKAKKKLVSITTEISMCREPDGRDHSAPGRDEPENK
jgi:hypothetical protein